MTDITYTAATEALHTLLNHGWDVTFHQLPDGKVLTVAQPRREDGFESVPWESKYSCFNPLRSVCELGWKMNDQEVVIS